MGLESKSKVCAHCGQEFSRRPGESCWGRRKYCSSACAGKVGGKLIGGHNKHQPTPADLKTCPTCGQEFERGLGKSDGEWITRVYCGSTCAAKGRYSPNIKAKMRRATASKMVITPNGHPLCEGAHHWRLESPTRTGTRGECLLCGASTTIPPEVAVF